MYALHFNNNNKSLNSTLIQAYKLQNALQQEAIGGERGLGVALKIAPCTAAAKSMHKLTHAANRML